MARQRMDIELSGDSLKRLQRGMKAVGEPQSPALRAGMDDVGKHLAGEVAHRAPRTLGGRVDYLGLNKGTTTNIAALGMVKHPAARSFEFGRKYYYRDFRRRGRGFMKKGRRFASTPGFREEHYIGVVRGDAALGATVPYAVDRLQRAIVEAWLELGAG